MSLTNLTSDEFSNKFIILINQQDGNCLFESLSNCVNEDQSIIRQKVYQFYKNFDRNFKYSNNSIEYLIVLGLEYDNNDGEFIHE